MYLTAITEFYGRGDAAARQVEVPELLHRLRDPQPLPDAEPRPGRAGEAHGGNDGFQWRLMSARGGPELEQTGFVEGYLACHAGLGGNRGGTFSRAASVYVAAISGWYRFDAVTGEMDRRRRAAPIAEVLFRFSDQAEARR
jgi:hypothetical protein